LNPFPDPPYPASGEIHLWTADLETFEPFAPRLGALLSVEEKNRCGRIRSREAARQRLLSRGILREILARYTGEDPQQLDLRVTAGGKPFLTGSDLVFNISHSKNLFLCGVSCSTDIGVDIQEVFPISNLPWIIGSYFSPAEQSCLRAMPDTQSQETFFAIWTAKEAWLKALGEGFQRSPQGFSVLPAPRDNRYLLMDESGRNPLDGGWTIVPVAISGDYKAALAVNSSVDTTVRYTFSPEALEKTVV
jgi:4'-phosphopantetheinyl transferase